MRISDCSSDVFSSDLRFPAARPLAVCLAGADRADGAGAWRGNAAAGVVAWLVVRAWAFHARAQLDRDRVHLSGGDAGVARLDRGGAAVAFSGGISSACGGAGVAVRAGRRAERKSTR